MSALPAVPGPERLPWERIPGETVKAWAAFCIYRDLLEGRSLSKAADLHRERLAEERKKGSRLPKRETVIAQFAKWSTKYAWVERSDAYLLALDRRRRDEMESERQRVDRSHAQLAARMLIAVDRRVRGDEEHDVDALNPNDMEWKDIAGIFDKATRAQRLAMHMPTDLIRGSLDIPPAQVAKMMRDVVELTQPFVSEDRQGRWFAVLERYMNTGQAW